VGGRIVAGEYFVEGKHRASVEVGLLVERAIDFVHVAVELFEKTLEAVEHGVERGLIASEVGANEFLASSLIDIIGAPELGDLVESAVEAGSLRLAIFRGQLAL
jgi:hypothetical protein